ncbi:MAG: helix-turn-helix transcriptional regulator [Candidatus Paracaedibacteraceae bacterium]|nr:helix-turn-helix transcriptional regulator [Candidatus Paracaedibacteraceae bacterium]
MTEDIPNYKSPDYIYAHHFKNMEGIPFTPREIDILASILSGKTVKTIAYLLTISPKTVETHMRNLMLKLNCNSREGIINFIEKTGKFSFFRQHYENLLVQTQFEKKTSRDSKAYP